MINELFDSLIMLTYSDWHSEARSNRYHYVSRFSKYFPIFFVQVNNAHPALTLEKDDAYNLYIIKVPNNYNVSVVNEIKAILELANIRKPLLWIYNSNFGPYLSLLPHEFIVYHATEAYLSPDIPFGYPKGSLGYESLMSTLEQTDLMISVSQGVQESYLQDPRVDVRSIVIANGCDFSFYRPDISKIKEFIKQRVNSKQVLYQGTIYNKIDFDLVHAVVDAMSEWQFVFCGKIPIREAKWHALLKKENVSYLGCLSVEQVREQMYLSNVGIIPFTKLDFLIERSLPLKAFEYLACGLPTVSVSIKSLLKEPDAFLFADDVDAFKKQIERAAQLSIEESYISQLITTAKKHDYDDKFEQAISEIKNVFAEMA